MFLTKQPKERKNYKLHQIKTKDTELVKQISGEQWLIEKKLSNRREKIQFLPGGHLRTYAPLK